MRASAKKFSQKVFGEAGVRLASTVFLLLLARHVGPADFGRYSTAVAFAAICIILVDLGTNAILTRELARHPEDKKRITEASHFLKLAASLSAWIVLASITGALGFDAAQRGLTLCLGAVAISQTLTEYFSALLNGVEEMGWEAVLKAGCRLLGLAPGFLALLWRQPLPVIAKSLAAGSLVSYAAGALVIRYRFGTFGIAVDGPFLKTLLRSSMPLFGSVLFLILYDSQDILLLNYFHRPPQEIGWFSGAMKIVDVARVYPALMMGVFFPTFSKLHASDPAHFKSKENRLMLFMAGSLLVMAAFLYAASPWIIRLLYRESFDPASAYLRLLLPALVGMGINHIQTQLVIALNREQKLLPAAALACAVNLVLAAILLPRIGAAGLCYALIGSEGVYFLYLRRLTVQGR